MSEHSDSRTNRSSAVWVALLIGAVIIAIAGYSMKHTISCFLLSFIFAYLLDPVLLLLERKNIRRDYGIALLYAILSILVFFFIVFMVPLLTTRWQELVRNLPGYVQKIKQLSSNLRNGYEPSFGTAEWQWLLDSLIGNLDKMTGKLGAGVYSAASKVAFNLFNLLLAPILVFFMLHYKNEINSELVRWLPPQRKELILLISSEINRSVGGYIRGQLIVSLIVAVLSTMALYFLDVDYALLNGLFAGAASILPFIGVILAMIPPLFFAYIKFQTLSSLLSVLAAFSIIYFVEGYLIKPLVFKEAMNLNPLVTIIFVMALGELMGFWGILLAIPIAAAVKITLEHLRKGDFNKDP
ncbi:AI-2E family transporter [Geobacter pelophilus]|uniref:AI-2E family transporter n=1 Tax=Geoanaerobacter pelophilus TaxID=60036 RepID=A0AAW4LBT2_9BACT|nr:AI-2E family transporter [Geoanaerobacter pelophilus]MBT0666040.1 AI-2E family transporter [Geoanaerobacter pelophilus]